MKFERHNLGFNGDLADCATFAYAHMVPPSGLTLRATVFNIRKRIICFYIWLIGDLLWFIFDFTSGTYGRSTLDLVQMVLAVCGIYSWRK